jgi:hypothetical protein
MRVKSFAWLPTPIYVSKYWRDGCAWLRWVYVDEDDGKAYRNKEKPRMRVRSGEDLAGRAIPLG